jgi:hypothetical protein
MRSIFAAVLSRAARSLLKALRWLARHQWFTAAAILATTIAALCLWTLLLPLPVVHGDYSIAKSLRFNDNDGANLSRSMVAGSSPADTNNLKKTYSFWVKRANLSTTQHIVTNSTDANNRWQVNFDSSDRIQLQAFSSGSTVLNKITTAVFRDPAAWLHVVIATDTTLATAEDRVKLYVNGTRIIAFGTNTNPSQNDMIAALVNTPLGGTWSLRVGVEHVNGTNYLDGYFSDFYLIDGQALTPLSFGEVDPTTGAWVARAYSGSYGTNGFHLDFADSSQLGNDVAGSNDWTSNNLDATDQVRDTPTNNFATWSPINKHANTTLSQGNLRNVGTTLNDRTAGNTFFVSSGKWYWEVTASTVSSTYPMTGFGLASFDPVSTSQGPGVAATTYSLLANNGNTYNNNSQTAYGSAISSGETIMVALDLDTGKAYWGKNCTWFNSGDPAAGTNAAFTGLSGTFEPLISDISSSASITNFGQSANPTSTATTLPFRSAAGGHFYCNPPTDFKALSTENLPAPAITKPSNYFDAKTYTGNGSTQGITGLNFQPALVWLKDRTSANSHGLFDAVHGVTKYLRSNSSAPEVTDANSLTAFNTNGFSLGNSLTFNASGNSYIAWNWKEDPAAGVDIVTYVGNGSNRTVAHSLGAVPAFLAIRATNNTENWQVGHQAMDATAPWNYGMHFDLTSGRGATSGYWNNTAPTASVFSLGTGNPANAYTATFIAYLWAEIPGFSKFGSYTGNHSTDGPFIYTGFKPRFIMLKQSSGTSNWVILDTAREPHNPQALNILPNSNGAESSNTAMDVLANGFKLRSTSGDHNNGNSTYIYAAFAELPFKYATAAATGETSPPFVFMEF